MVKKKVGMNSVFLINGSSEQDYFTSSYFVHSVVALSKHCSLLCCKGKSKEFMGR